MTRHLTLALLTLACLAPLGRAATDDLSGLNDEFDRPETLTTWKRHDVVEGWPSQWKTLEVSGGLLRIEPYSSAWVDGYRAPFVFREVTGDFVVTTRIRARGQQTDVPKSGWSLTGLMARAPRPGVTPGTWTTTGENWVFLTVGTADAVGQPQLEDKTTRSGRSRLRTRPSRPGWVELRLARVGPAVLLLRRFEGEAWVLHQRFEREDLPPTLQVGVNAYTDFDRFSERVASRELSAAEYNRQVYRDGNPDLISEVDWIRFARPAVPERLRGLNLYRADVSDADLLAFLGF